MILNEIKFPIGTGKSVRKKYERQYAFQRRANIEYRVYLINMLDWKTLLPQGGQYNYIIVKLPVTDLNGHSISAYYYDSKRIGDGEGFRMTYRELEVKFL